MQYGIARAITVKTEAERNSQILGTQAAHLLGRLDTVDKALEAQRRVEARICEVCIARREGTEA